MTKNRILGCIAVLAALCMSAQATPTPLPVPDAGSSVLLLSVAMAGIGACLNRFRGSNRS